ncbi:hypothetical protein F4678DRAFT_420521, partial [Xylaria arbuscula]
MDQPVQTPSSDHKIPIQRGAEPHTILFRGEDGVEYTFKILPLPYTTASLNNMEYTDNNGVFRSIYLPPGTVHQAWDHLENERWDELAKFAPFTNQRDTEDDSKKFRELKEKERGKQDSPKVD